ncbi:MAG: hypothetical protein KF799_14530 [Bdellovibrionales bacterium]|nr:hypothetical protein [Bdellovibrionales bacterium]
MQELNHRLTFLFSVVGLLVCLGKFENRDLQTYVLDDGLIVRQDSIYMQPTIGIAHEITVVPEEKAVESKGRMPASEISFYIPKLGTKRKPKTMIAEATATTTDNQIERSQKLAIDSTAMTALLSQLPQDGEVLAQMPEEERSIALDLFTDLSYDAVVDSLQPTSTGGFLVQGHMAGIPDSSFQMVQENGQTVANIFSQQLQYEVRAENGGHIVHQINPAKIAATGGGGGGGGGGETVAPVKVAATGNAPKYMTMSASASELNSKATSACAVHIESPNGKELLSQSVGEKILWSSNSAGDVRIKLFKGDQDLGTIARTANVGSALIRIPNLVEPGTDYRIRIEMADDASCFDDSDETFSLVP